MATQPTRPRAWPTHAKRAAVQIDTALEKAARKCDDGIETVYHQRSPDVSNAHFYQVARHIADCRRMLREALDGTPDDLSTALEIIREMRAGMTPDSNRQADELLAKYEG